MIGSKENTKKVQQAENNNLPEWARFPIKKLHHGVDKASAVLMGHYLVVMVHDNYDESDEEDCCGSDCDCGRSHSKSESESNPGEPATLLAIDLRDYSVQEATVEEFYYQRHYSWTKYGDNQIIRFGGGKNNVAMHIIQIITIQSFQPFSFKIEELEDSKKKPRLRNHTAQIYQDCLYLYGGRNADTKATPMSDLWCYDINRQKRTLCKTEGEDPGARFDLASSIFQDNLYIYGGDKEKRFWTLKDVFVLNLRSMKWTQLQQQETCLKQTFFDSDFYKNNLIILGDRKEYKSGPKHDALYCWNIDTNSWKNFDIKGFELGVRVGKLTVYKNLLLALFAENDGFSMGVLNLESLDLPTSKSSEKEHLFSLFLNEEGSDISFRVEEKILPAHKEVLIRKSKYFANLFNSGMIESRQEIIKLNDCEFHVFQEFLRFLYCDEVKLEPDLAFKLLTFSDKYLQNDLNEKCMNYLMYDLTSDNVYMVLDLARENEYPSLQNWCLKFIQNNLNIDNISKLIKYLDQQNPEYAKEDTELRDKALNFIFENYIMLRKKHQENLQFSENFLIQNIDFDTILKMVNFMSGKTYESLIPSQYAYARSDQVQEDTKRLLFEKDILNFRTAVFTFVHKNYEALQQKQIIKRLPASFLHDFISDYFIGIPHPSLKKSALKNSTLKDMPEDSEKSEDDDES